MEDILQIRVIYFAKLRDLIGLDEEIFSMKKGMIHPMSWHQ